LIQELRDSLSSEKKKATSLELQKKEQDQRIEEE